MRRCALCNCGEPSLHGQRELRRFELPFDWPRCPVVSPGGNPGPSEGALPSEDLSQIGFPEGLTPAPCLVASPWTEAAALCWSVSLLQRWPGSGGRTLAFPLSVVINNHSEHFLSPHRGRALGRELPLLSPQPQEAGKEARPQLAE